MAQRHSFWIIVAGSTPTSFRARRAEDLLPTLRQLQRTQPDTVLRWFERGKLWDSPDAAREPPPIIRRHLLSGGGLRHQPDAQHRGGAAEQGAPIESCVHRQSLGW